MQKYRIEKLFLKRSTIKNTYTTQNQRNYKIIVIKAIGY